MRNKKNKHLGIEIDPELHFKLHYISKYYGRSANGEILYLIRQEIKNFEKLEGEIEIPETGDDVIASVLNVIEGKTELLQDVTEASVLSLVSTILTAYYDVPNEKIERMAEIVITTSRFVKGELL